jgi:hypothetical protein
MCLIGGRRSWLRRTDGDAGERESLRPSPAVSEETRALVVAAQLPLAAAEGRRGAHTVLTLT